MRTFDLTHSTTNLEAVKVFKNLRSAGTAMYYNSPYLFGDFERTLIHFWEFANFTYEDNVTMRSTLFRSVPVLRDFVRYVIQRVPIYFVTTSQIGQTIEVEEFVGSKHSVTVPTNVVVTPVFAPNDLGEYFEKWERMFQEHLEAQVESKRRRWWPYPECEAPFGTIKETGEVMEVRAEALYCPTGGDGACKMSHPEIFVYLDYFLDAKGHLSRPFAYLSYVIAHELAHAMMDERLWEAFLCPAGHTLSCHLNPMTKRYVLYEEGLATAIGWTMVERNPGVAREIMKSGLPYRFGLSPYYHCSMPFSRSQLCNTIREHRLPEWLRTKMIDPAPFL